MGGVSGSPNLPMATLRSARGIPKRNPVGLDHHDRPSSVFNTTLPICKGRVVTREEDKCIQRLVAQLAVRVVWKHKNGKTFALGLLCHSNKYRCL